MKQVLKVVISQNNHVLAQGDNLNLEPHSTSTARKFFFKNLRIEKENDFSYADLSRITIQVILIRESDELPIYEFKILLLEYKEAIEDEWWVYGLIYDYYEEEYRQGLIDVFSMWQREEILNWINKSTDQKHDYIIACLHYSSIRKTMISQDSSVFQIDVSLVKEDEDFFFFFGEMFFGERGYMGHSMHTFTDCLVELRENNGLVIGQKICFLKTKKINDQIVEETFREIKAILIDFHFVIDEKE